MTSSRACPFCSLPKDRIWLDEPLAMAFRDAYPVTLDHTLVVPRQHVATIFDLGAEALEQLLGLVGRVREALAQDPEIVGFNIGVNDGKAAGQTIDHAHIHVIPRREGDIADPRGGFSLLILRWMKAVGLAPIHHLRLAELPAGAMGLGAVDSCWAATTGQGVGLHLPAGA